MSAGSLSIITTKLPPRICGVGTYSWRLHQAWPYRDATARFLVSEGAAQSRAELHFDHIHEHRCHAQTLLRELPESDILLHYAARAYNRFGIPHWILKGLERWRALGHSGRIIIQFHEMPAKMPITSRHFLPNLLNTRIIRKLASLADILVTNTADQANTLTAISNRQDVHVIPVGANIEPGGVVVPARQHSEFVLFGLPFGRVQTLRRFEEFIGEWIRAGTITKLHVIGPRDEGFAKEEGEILSRTGAAPIAIVHGALPEEEVSQLLSQAGFALTNVTAKTWSKSGVFMSCAAHECAVVAAIGDGSMPLRCVVEPREVSTLGVADIKDRTSALRIWYKENADWPVIAHRFAKLQTQRGRGSVI